MKRETIARKWLGFGLFISVTCASAQAPEDCASECNAPTVDIPVLAHAESFKLSAPPSNHRLDGQLDEWTVAGDANLFDAKVPRHEQRLWLAASDAGIVVAMQSGSLLKVEIASLDALHVPQISWRSRRIDSVWYTGLAACADEHPSEGVRYSVEDCERWYAEQVAYRRELAHEFVRRFEIETDGTVIDVDGARTRHLVLRPNGMPQVKAVAKYERATDLEMLIPWEALPLADNVELSKLYLRIRRCAVGSTGGIAHCADATESRDALSREIREPLPLFGGGE